MLALTAEPWRLQVYHLSQKGMILPDKCSKYNVGGSELRSGLATVSIVPRRRLTRG